MGLAARKLFQLGIKIAKDNPDFGNPINVDTLEFMVSVGKGVLSIGKEILLPWNKKWQNF